MVFLVGALGIVEKPDYSNTFFTMTDLTRYTTLLLTISIFINLVYIYFLHAQTQDIT